MTWTYVAPTTDRDKVRFLSGDNDTTDQLVTDEEIAYILTVRTNLHLAAADACEAIAAKWARKADTSNGALSVSASQRAAAYHVQAQELRARANGLGAPTWFAGGQTVSGKDTLTNDSDAVQPAFRVGQDDLPGTPDDGDDDTAEND